MTGIRIGVVVFASGFLAPTLSWAGGQELDCPREISFIQNLPAAKTVLSLLETVYEEVGCHTEFNPYPGRRSVVLFNTRKIDGQFARLTIIEKDYEREFVRSKYPVNEALAAEWKRPGSAGFPSTNEEIGYTIGVKWQDNYVADKALVRGFDDPAEKIKAYKEGLIDRFLETDQNLKLMISQGQTSEFPQLVSEIKKFEAYHYVGVEFSEFMDRFDQALAKKKKTQK